MKVELLKPIPGKSYFNGDIIDLPMDQARLYIESGHCIPSNEEMQKLEKANEPQTAESQKPLSAETAQAVIRKGKRK